VKAIAQTIGVGYLEEDIKTAFNDEDLDDMAREVTWHDIAQTIGVECLEMNNAPFNDEDLDDMARGATWYDQIFRDPKKPKKTILGGKRTVILTLKKQLYYSPLSNCLFGDQIEETLNNHFKNHNFDFEIFTAVINAKSLMSSNSNFDLRKCLYNIFLKNISWPEFEMLFTSSRTIQEIQQVYECCFEYEKSKTLMFENFARVIIDEFYKGDKEEVERLFTDLRNTVNGTLYGVKKLLFCGKLSGCFASKTIVLKDLQAINDKINSMAFFVEGIGYDYCAIPCPTEHDVDTLNSGIRNLEEACIFAVNGDSIAVVDETNTN